MRFCTPWKFAAGKSGVPAMRLYSSGEQISLTTESFSQAQCKGPIGRFGIRLTRKQAKMMDSRLFTLELMSRVNWVEEGILLVIGQILFSEDALLPYFMGNYADGGMAVEQRRTENDEERRPLLFRLRRMLRTMKSSAGNYEKFEQWRFTGLEFALQSFADVVRQAFGAEAHEKVYAFYRRLRNLWKAVSPELDSPEAVRAELEKLIDESDRVFQFLLLKIVRLDEERAKARAAVATPPPGEIDNMQQIAKVAINGLNIAASAIDKSIAQNRCATRVLAKVAGITGENLRGRDDPADPEACLRGLNATRREEMRLVLALTEKFPLVRGGKKGSNTPDAVAHKCWVLNKESFAEKAKLSECRGFPSAEALASGFQRIIRHYPNSPAIHWHYAC